MSNLNDYPHGDLTRFQRDRFGMFIHWGIYSMHAVHEWCKLRDRIPEGEYQFMVDHFEPDLFDPAGWARSARQAGMRYAILTTKHHDGFCMWDSAFTDYKVTRTPFGRDVVRAVVDAFRAEGLRVGLYYSISDWHHPDFLIDASHSLGHLPAEEIARLNAGRDMRRYAGYMRDQVRELLTSYGELCELWFDVSGKICPVACESEEMVRLVRSLQPQVILNNRLELPGSADILTPEGYVRDSGCVDAQGEPVPWEGCLCLGATWGYNRDEKSYFRSPLRILEALITHTGMGGNSLFNIGPDGRGRISRIEAERLEFLGRWMELHARSIYGCGPPPKDLPPPPRDCRYTYNPATNRLYLHLMRWPEGEVVIHGLSGRVRYAQLLNDGSRLQMTEAGPAGDDPNPRLPAGSVAVRLMSAPDDVAVPVIELLLHNADHKDLP